MPDKPTSFVQIVELKSRLSHLTKVILVWLILLKVFNIQTTLTDFSESFEELEREYRRLKTEEELEQKLLAE